MPLKGKNQLVQRLRDKSDQLCRALMLEAHGRLIRKTPVRTGRARNNWNVGIGAVDLSTTDKGSYPKGGGEAMQAGITKIGSFKAGDVGFITNALPYVKPLEEGSSTQAPKGMVKVTKKELKPLVAQILAKLATGAID